MKGYAVTPSGLRCLALGLWCPFPDPYHRFRLPRGWRADKFIGPWMMREQENAMK